MIAPKVSIIMPAHNQEKYIADSIDSVIRQSYADWELIVIDDGSTDMTAEIVKRYNDPRVLYFHQSGQGVSIARNNGINYSKGEYVAFLDADDLFHVDKLRIQTELLNSQPDIGLTYVSRFEIDRNGLPLNIVMQPESCGLSAVVLGFPFAPSDLMIRRLWIEKTGGFNATFVINEDRDLYIRLILEGCKCKGVKQFMSYRRLNDQKSFKDLPARMNDMERALMTAFNDNRSLFLKPNVKKDAFYAVYQIWAYQAAVQNDSRLAGQYYRKSLESAEALNDLYKVWKRFLIHASIRDGGDHEQKLKSVFNCFPEEFHQLAVNLDDAIRRGYVIRGVREQIWGRSDAADQYLRQVDRLELCLDDELISILVDMIINFERVYDSTLASLRTSEVLMKFREKVSWNKYARFAVSCSMGQAFLAFDMKNFMRVIDRVAYSSFLSPSLLFNRGMISIFVRSVVHAFANALRAKPMSSNNGTSHGAKYEST